MEKKRLIKILVTLLFCLFLGTFLYSVYHIIEWKIANKKTSEIVNDLQNKTVVTEVVSDLENEDVEIINPKEEAKENPYWDYIKMNMIDVDFKGLKERNSDTKGWIQVNGTNINYPFVQAKDNKYYLTHSFDKKYTDAGWVFLDYRNDINNLGRNNIIYGHARLDKTMFGTLSKTINKSWYNNKNNHIIKLSTETENTLWQIFSVYYIKTESYYITTSFTDETFQTFIDTISKRSVHKFNTNVTIDDKILTLSTCHGKNQKTVVHAKLIKRESKNQ